MALKRIVDDMTSWQIPEGKVFTTVNDPELLDRIERFYNRKGVRLPEVF